MYGYWGKILRVDLTKEKSSVQLVNEGFFKKYLGGAGVGAKLLFDSMDPNVDPLSPDNVIIFSDGPFQGTTIPGSGRWVIVSRSPLTGIYTDSCAGASWGPLFKRTGFDALLITGRAKNPVYLWIHDGDVEIRDASTMWGKTTTEADREIKEDIGEPKAAVACIGPAGERLVRFASGPTIATVQMTLPRSPYMEQAIHSIRRFETHSPDTWRNQEAQLPLA